MIFGDIVEPLDLAVPEIHNILRIFRQKYSSIIKLTLNLLLLLLLLSHFSGVRLCVIP